MPVKSPEEAAGAVEAGTAGAATAVGYCPRGDAAIGGVPADAADASVESENTSARSVARNTVVVDVGREEPRDQRAAVFVVVGVIAVAAAAAAIFAILVSVGVVAPRRVVTTVTVIARKDVEKRAATPSRIRRRAIQSTRASEQSFCDV